MASVADVYTVRKPRVTEVSAMKDLIDAEVPQGNLLPRTLVELYENIRDFQVYVDERGVGGCCALHVDLPNLAEVRSLVVRGDLRGQNVGGKLLTACIREARELGLPRVYALTRACSFFERHGFYRVDKEALPHKVYRDCLRCRLYPKCDEIAMVCDLPPLDESAYYGDSSRRSESAV
jgi:amino-acid N-acetyltransferase